MQTPEWKFVTDSLHNQTNTIMAFLALLYAALSFAVCEALLTKMSDFETVMKEDVIFSEEVTSARSAVECIEQCAAYSHCITAAYDSASRQCYLHPSSSSGSAGPAALAVYRNTGRQKY